MIRRAFLLLNLLSFAVAFSPSFVSKPPRQTTTLLPSSSLLAQRECSRAVSSALSATNNGNAGDGDTCWNPKLRRTMGAVASLGALETAYLTVDKLTGAGSVEAFCGLTAGDCSSVLNGPYAVIPGTGVPLAAMGFLAYTAAAALALGPILQKQTDDSDNRVQLTCLSTAMGVFSIFLMSLLFGVLKESCTFCIASATFSIVLAKLAWLGGAVPKDRFKEGLACSTKSALAALTASVVLFAATEDTSAAVNVAGELIGTAPGSSTSLVADAAAKQVNAPPAIANDSSPRALKLATKLQSLDAKLYGAYWCSHCYEQKETLGRQAFAKIPYIECSKDGLNEQTKLCKAKNVPGYPTWEINGKLFPGDQELDELEEIVQGFKQ